GPAALGTLQYVRARFHLAQLASSLTATNPVVAGRLQALGGALGATQTDPALRSASGGAQLAQQTLRAANVLAFNDVFMPVRALSVGALLVFASLFLIRAVRKPPTSPSAASVPAR